jgi:nicotinate-nucleotide adenylyltransferase
MNVGLFGGTFDPIHRGHLAHGARGAGTLQAEPDSVCSSKCSSAQAAPAFIGFPHRYAMIALAASQDKDFVPSLLEAPEELETDIPGRKKEKEREAKPNYTIDTVERVKQSFKKADRLFLLIGIDAFADIAKWHRSEDLFRECEFVVASRPGYSLADVANALPARLRPREEATRPFHKQAAKGRLGA